MSECEHFATLLIQKIVRCMGGGQMYSDRNSLILATENNHVSNKNKESADLITIFILEILMFTITLIFILVVYVDGHLFLNVLAQPNV